MDCDDQSKGNVQNTDSGEVMQRTYRLDRTHRCGRRKSSTNASKSSRTFRLPRKGRLGDNREQFSLQ